MKVPKVITSWKNSRRQTVSNDKNIKRIYIYIYIIHNKIFHDQNRQRKQGFEVKKNYRNKRLFFFTRRISAENHQQYTRVGTLIVATIYLQLIQSRYMFRSFTVLQCSHQHCVQPFASDVEVVGYL